MAVELSMSRSRMSSISTGCASIGVRIGGLWKRSQGLSRFTKPNYKHRVFILTDQSLSYYAGTIDRVGQQKGRIDLASIRAVEFVDIAAFNLAHTIQIVYFTKKSGFVKLYVTATDSSESTEWVAALRQVCYFNKDMLMHYHPGAFVRNKWTCCKQRGQEVLGCQPTYHLLTRSSSRYAAMRRKDTLTNRQQGRTRNASGASTFSTIDRRSGSVFQSAHNITAVSQVPEPGKGLSNSCMDLAVHPPHRIESFIGSYSPLSQRSSRHSEHVIMTRVSFASSECGSSQSLKRKSKSQVAPELQPVLVDFPSDGTSIAACSIELSGSTDPNTLNLSSSSEHDISPPPVPPPRTKQLTQLKQSQSTQFIPKVVPISEASSERLAKSTLKHSNTFVVQRNKKKSAGLRKVDRELSHSMSALSKPLIVPKFSTTNPNIIHV